jgi:hypothetical protein
LIESHTTQENDYLICQVCGQDSDGFRYFSEEHYLYLHPCCAEMPMRVVQDGRAFQLVKDTSATCRICGDKSPSLAYRTSDDDGQQVYLHVLCLVITHNKLNGNQDWTPSAPIRQGVMGAYPRKVNNGGGGAMQTVGTVLSGLNLLVKLATEVFQ